MPTVRAKVICSKATNMDGTTSLRFSGVYSEDPHHENKQFSDATPHINISMTIAADRPAADAFVDGREYFLDFTLVNKQYIVQLDPLQLDAPTTDA